jgi:serine/threonine protein kinase
MANPLTGDPTSSGPLEPGTTLQNRYVVERLLGGGGMGMVYLAHDQRLANRGCAIKEMVDHFIDPQQRIEANDYFAREADTLAQLKHAAIPAITDRFDDRNRHYLVMEYVEGRNLEEELHVNGGPLAEGLVIDIARQLSDVLGYLHGLNPPIIYRDMKPSNVMLTPRGRVVLIDFGIARLFRAARKGTMIGTLGFAPPEQYQGAVDPRSDIYSLGATLHYVLTARDPEKFPPFSFPPVRDLRPDVSSNLAGAIDRALAYEADNRPANIQEFRDMLLYGRGLASGGASAVSSRGGTAGLPPIPAHVTAIRKPRSGGAKRVIGYTLFALLTGGLAFGATYVYSNPDLQDKFGVRQWIDSLPWKHQELIEQARQHPLDFQRLTLALSNRDGTPITPPQASFTDTQLNNTHYLQWTATFKNGLAGLEGRSNKVDAKFFDPGGVQIASSSASQFIGPGESSANFSGVALMPDLGNRPAGTYKVALYLGDQTLAEQSFTVTQDLAARARAATEAEAAAFAARAEAAKREAEAKRLAMLEERKVKPLELVNIQFVNSTKSGTELSGPATSFGVSKVLFVGWQVTFKNRLFGLETNEYRVDAAYIAPNGSTLGSVNDVQMVPRTARSQVFSGRVGNSAGGAFLPGVYTVNFYLNGQYFAQKKFRVVSDGSPPTTYGMTSPGPGSSPSSSFPPLDGPLVAKGQINGIGGHDNVAMELRLRPQSNGFLHGELVVHESGYGLTPIEGFVRGDHLQFQVPYGTETFYFEGQRGSDRLSGTFESTPTGERGTWTSTAN